MITRKNVPAKAATFKFEYVTCTASLLVAGAQGDGIVVHAVNDSTVAEQVQVMIYHNTGAGAVTVYDSGPIAVVPTWQWGLGYTVKASGEYWVRIRASSQFLIPKVSFDRIQNGVWTPLVTYRPGDFAIFQLLPTRKRLW